MAGEERHESYADFYVRGQHARFRYERRQAGALPVSMIRSLQGAHELKDEPTPDLLLGLILGGTAHARWRWAGGSRWLENTSRRPGDIGISPSRTEGEYEILAAQELLILALPFDELKGDFDDSDVLVPHDFGTLHTEYFRSAFVRRLTIEMWNSAEIPSPLNDLKVDSCANVLLAELVRLSQTNVSVRPEQGKLSFRQLDLVRQWVDDHTHRPVRLMDLASLLGVSVRQFQRRFKNSTGISPYRFTLERRIERARVDLVSTTDSISEIALRNGFSDQSHLTRTFREVLGASPSTYRKH